METQDDKRWRIFDEINQERVRQDAKWGEQNHPDVDRVLTDRVPARLQRSYNEREGELALDSARRRVDRWIAEGKIATTVKSLRGKGTQRTAGGAR